MDKPKPKSDKLSLCGLRVEVYADLQFDLSFVQKVLFCDLETTGLDPLKDEISLVQISNGEKAYLLEAPHFKNEKLKKILEDPEVQKVFHNAHFDLKFLKGKLFSDLEPQNIYCTDIGERLVTCGKYVMGGHATQKHRLRGKEAKAYALESIVRRRLAVELDKDKKLRTSFKPGAKLTQEQIDYAVGDVAYLPEVMRQQLEEVATHDLQEVLNVELGLIPFIADVSLTGLYVDRGKLESLHKKYEKETRKFAKAFPKELNLNSPAQLIQFFRDEHGLVLENTQKGYLKSLNYPAADRLIAYKEAETARRTFQNHFIKHLNASSGRIHPSFRQIGAESGRIMSYEPNLQNVGRDEMFRSLFIPPEGYKYVICDYSQIEMRVLAQYTKDPEFLAAFANDEDLHSKSAAAALRIPLEKVTREDRDIGKTINFGLAYGQTEYGLAYQLGISKEEAKEFINNYFGIYRRTKQVLEHLGSLPKKRGYAETLLGRKRWFEPPRDWYEEQELVKEGKNTPIQGTAADIFKTALLLMKDSLRPFDCRVVHLVHDEFIVEVRADQAEEVAVIMKQDSETAGNHFLDVSVVVDPVITDKWVKK